MTDKDLTAEEPSDQTLLMQRLVDPRVCVSCFGCHETCPRGAVMVNGFRLAVEPTLCDQCEACVSACSTGAINSFRSVPRDGTYTVEEQWAWEELPPDEF